MMELAGGHCYMDLISQFSFPFVRCPCRLVVVMPRRVFDVLVKQDPAV